MRCLGYQFGLSLAVLLAWPLLGGGNQTQAAFLIPGNGSTDSSRGMSTLEFGSQPDYPNTPTEKRLSEDLAWLLGVDPLRGSGLTRAGSGCGSPPSGPSLSGSVFVADSSSAVNLSPLSVARWLYFEDVHYRPPPFASRLFRPPRWV
jgi:hypothetical protein